MAIYGIPVPLRPALNIGEGVVDEVDGTLVTDKVVEGAAPMMTSLGAESTCFDVNLLNRLFSKKIRTMKCIPPKARLGFAKLFRSALDMVLARRGDLSAWVQLLILPACVLSTFVPTNRA